MGEGDWRRPGFGTVFHRGAGGRIDELALVARSLLSGWRGESIPPDESFARSGLSRLVGPEAAADICARAFAEGRQWIGLNTENDAPSVGRDGVSVHPQLEQRLLVQIAETSYWIESGLAQGRDLATNYSQRGTAWAQLRQKNESAADFRRSLQLVPENNSVRYRLAVTLSDEGDFQEADLVFADGAKRAPPDAGEKLKRGAIIFSNRDVLPRPRQPTRARPASTPALSRPGSCAT